MAKNQARTTTSTTTDDPEPWIGDDATDFEDDSVRPAAEAVPKAKVAMAARNRIEDLLDRRRLQKQIDDYESFDFDEDTATRVRRTH